MTLPTNVTMPRLGGQTFQLNVNLNDKGNLEKITKAGKGDGLDQVYVHDPKSNQSYVIQGDGLDLSKDMKKGRLSAAIIPINGKMVEVDVKAVDNEVNTAGEGLKSFVTIGSSAIGLGTAGYAFNKAASLGPVIEKTQNIWKSLDMIGTQGKMKWVALGGLAAAGLALAGGAIYGAVRPADEESLKSFIQGPDVGVKIR